MTTTECTTTPTECRDRCYAMPVTVTRIDGHAEYGYTVSGPGGTVDCVRVYSGDWWLFGARRRTGEGVRIGTTHNGIWSYGYAMSLARRFAAGDRTLCVVSRLAKKANRPAWLYG